MDTLSPIEIDIGRKVASCSRIFWTQHIFLFRSTVMPSPPHLEVFTAQFVFRFVFMGGFGFLGSSISFVLHLIKLTETSSLYLSFCIVLLFKITITVTPSIWGYRSKSLSGDAQTTSHIPISISTGLSVAIGSRLDKLSFATCRKANLSSEYQRLPMGLHSNRAAV